MSEPKSGFIEAWERSLEKARSEIEAGFLLSITRKCCICGEQEEPRARAYSKDTWLCPDCCDKLRNLMGVTEWS